MGLCLLTATRLNAEYVFPLALMCLDTVALSFRLYRIPYLNKVHSTRADSRHTQVVKYTKWLQHVTVSIIWVALCSVLLYLYLGQCKIAPAIGIVVCIPFVNKMNITWLVRAEFCITHISCICYVCMVTVVWFNNQIGRAFAFHSFIWKCEQHIYTHTHTHSYIIWYALFIESTTKYINQWRSSDENLEREKSSSAQQKWTKKAAQEPRASIET